MPDGILLRHEDTTAKGLLHLSPQNTFLMKYFDRVAKEKINETLSIPKDKNMTKCPRPWGSHFSLAPGSSGEKTRMVRDR